MKNGKVDFIFFFLGLICLWGLGWLELEQGLELEICLWGLGWLELEQGLELEICLWGLGQSELELDPDPD